MLRRAFLAAVALLLSGRLSFAQQQPNGEKTVPEVLDVQGLITKALRVAASVEDGAEQMLRQAADQAFRRVEVPGVKLREVPPSRFPNLFVAQGNLATLLFAVLLAAKTAEGRIVVTRTAVEQSLREYCPLYPFC